MLLRRLNPGAFASWPSSSWLDLCPRRFYKTFLHFLWTTTSKVAAPFRLRAQFHERELPTSLLGFPDGTTIHALAYQIYGVGFLVVREPGRWRMRG